MSQPIEHTQWAKLLWSRFANVEGYIPSESNESELQFLSHET